MHLRISLLFLVSIAVSHLAKAQSSVYIRNSTHQEFAVTVEQYGTHTMEANEWQIINDTAETFVEGDNEVFVVNRDTVAIPNGDTIYFDIDLEGEVDTLTARFRLIGTPTGSTLDYSITVNGFSDAWYNDGNFHELSANLDGREVIVKYKPDNNDNGLSRDVRFALHNSPAYEIDSVDFQNANVLNIMAYNIQMLPFGVSGLPQAEDRAALFPAEISPYQDVVSFAEAFDTDAREQFLEPAMQAAGFPYKTTILNDPGGGFLPWNGGVIIFSRWPIEATAEYDFELCGPNASDCLANKGIKYASINKLGKRYHIFGTHMDAGSGQEDYDAKLSQIGEMRRFIAEQNIPPGEAVVFGGDFNIAPIDDDSLYFNFLDSLHPVLPLAIGDDDSNFSDRFGNIIDHVWGDSRHLLPLEATNRTLAFRSLDEDLWDLSEFSDHKSVIARFVYPDIASNGKDTILCPGESITLNINTSFGVELQWYKDGQEIVGETSNSYTIQNSVESDSGHYECSVRYQRIYGDTTGPLIPVFFPYGPDTINANLVYDMGVINVDSILCQVGVGEVEGIKLEAYPNPGNGIFNITMPPALISTDALLQVYDALGRHLLTVNRLNPQTKLDLSAYGSGVYNVLLVSGSKSASVKVMVK